MSRDARGRSDVQIVAQGYDAIVDRYLAWIDGIEGDPRMAWLEAFAERLPPGGRVLELGCGAGVPLTVSLAARFETTGVDISPGQIARARELVPAARFFVGDMTSLTLDETFDGVAAFTSIPHVPRELHAAVFGRIAGWLRPGGWFVAALGGYDDPGWTGEWLGVPMFFSSFDPDTSVGLMAAARLRTVRRELVTMREPEEGDVTFLWVLARRD
jgi:SAM-dependent methyltransferase